MGRHALVEVSRAKGHDDGAHSSQIIDTKLTRTNECTRCCPDMTAFDQRLNNGQFAMRGTFLHKKL
jgi:hypothetical protein